MWQYSVTAIYHNHSVLISQYICTTGGAFDLLASHSVAVILQLTRVWIAMKLQLKLRNHHRTTNTLPWAKVGVPITAVLGTPVYRNSIL